MEQDVVPKLHISLSKYLGIEHKLSDEKNQEICFEENYRHEIELEEFREGYEIKRKELIKKHKIEKEELKKRQEREMKKLKEQL